MTTEIITIEAREVQSQNLFGDWLMERFIKFAGVMPKSQSTYKTALRQMFRYFTANAIKEPAREDLINWRDALITGAVDSNGLIHFDGEVTPDGRIFRLITENKVTKMYLVDSALNKKCLAKSPATVQLYLTSAKIFFKWLVQENIFPNIADHLKIGVKVNHDHKKDALSATQAGTLIKGVNYIGKKEKHNTLREKRDRAIIALMAATGARCIEVSRADVGDMKPECGKTFLVIQGKGHSSKDAQILLPMQVVGLIQDYLSARGDTENSQPLFTSTANRNRGSRLSSQTISKMVKANLRAAGLDTPRLTAHSLRHTAALTMLDNKVSLLQIKNVLRHVSISTTQIYADHYDRLQNMAEQTAANAIFDTISA